MDLKQIIERNINSRYGNSLEFNLLALDQSHFVLITPFIDNESNFIELQLEVNHENAITITDFGRGAVFLDQLRDKAVPKSFGLKEAWTCLRKLASNEISINTPVEKVGESVARIMGLLQKIYNLGTEVEKEDTEFGNIFRTQIEKNYADCGKAILFQQQIELLISNLGKGFTRDYRLQGKSGHLKQFKYMIRAKPIRLLNLVICRDFKVTENEIKMCHSDFLDINRRQGSCCLIFNDQPSPQTWLSLKTSGVLNMLAQSRIKYFAYYQDYQKLMNYLAG